MPQLVYCLYYYYTSVCGEPVVPLGYKLYSIASRTYGSIVPVICGSRYTGKPKAIRCNADGVWSTPTGCAVPGTRIVSEYDQEISQSQTADKPLGIMRKSHITITRHRKDKQSKVTSSLFPVEMIAKLEWTQYNAQQNIGRFQNLTMRVTINNESLTKLR